MLDDSSEGVMTMYRSLEGAEFDNAIIFGNRDGQAKRVIVDVTSTNLQDSSIFMFSQ